MASSLSSSTSGGAALRSVGLVSGGATSSACWALSSAAGAALEGSTEADMSADLAAAVEAGAGMLAPCASPVEADAAAATGFCVVVLTEISHERIQRVHLVLIILSHGDGLLRLLDSEVGAAEAQPLLPSPGAGAILAREGRKRLISCSGDASIPPAPR
eukprot:scaffold927_cov230-Pinguiococcus_pyrenoidosus.AAC.11